VGVEKLDAMCRQFSDEERTQMHAFKAAFDPQGLLNPGKLIPMLARCGEVRQGVADTLGQTPALREALATLPRF
jgi:glycolate oxidase